MMLDSEYKTKSYRSTLDITKQTKHFYLPGKHHNKIRFFSPVASTISLGKWVK